MTVVTINGVEYVDFKARFLKVYSTGVFVFRVLEPGAKPTEEWGASHTVTSQQEPPAGCFGLPSWSGGMICPNVHICRLRLGWARAQEIL